MFSRSPSIRIPSRLPSFQREYRPLRRRKRVPIRPTILRDPVAATAARAASVPLAVRDRRERLLPKQYHPAYPVDAETGLAPGEKYRYERLKARGDLMREDGSLIPPDEWLQNERALRSRIRGAKSIPEENRTQVTGQRIYLPNINFRMVRNHTPAGQAYNPYEATFRIPNSMTKNDVRSYLDAMYGVKCTYIRTDNYFPPLVRHPGGAWVTSRRDKVKSYKRAVVGLVDPFYYPLAIEDMSTEEREARENWIEETFGPQIYRDGWRMRALEQFKKNSHNWNWRGGLVAQKGKVLALIAEKRREREKSMSLAVKQFAKKQDTPLLAAPTSSPPASSITQA